MTSRDDISSTITTDITTVNSKTSNRACVDGHKTEINQRTALPGGLI
jgi:hypothetical protein